MNKILYFYLINTYNNIIHLYKKNSKFLILNLKSEYESLILVKFFMKWLLCLNKYNNYLCNLCVNCIYYKNKININDYIFSYNDLFNKNLNNNLNIFKILDYKFNKLNIIFINNFNNYFNNKLLINILNVLIKKNNFFLIIVENYNFLDKYILNKCILINLHKYDKIFLFNYIKKKYKFNNSSILNLLNISDFSLINSIKIIKHNFINIENMFFKIMEKCIIKNNFLNILNLFIDLKLSSIIIKLFIIFIIDLLKLKFKIKNIINNDKLHLINIFILKLKFFNLIKFTKKIIKFFYYNKCNKYFNNEIFILYNMFFINELLIKKNILSRYSIKKKY